MTFADRTMRSLFVACAVGLGWGIRGDFGGMEGAMYPGCVLGLAFCFVSGQALAARWAPVLGLVMGVGIGLGGQMSYGILHGYAQADTFVNYSYGFLTLFLQGGAWGVFGCGLAGLLLERPRLTAYQFASGLFMVCVFGAALYGLVVGVMGFDVNPPRSNLSVAFTGGVAGWFLWLSACGFRLARKAAFLGWLGFGLGMSVGRFAANCATHLPFSVNHWNIMEISVGLVGGFVFTFGMLGKRFPHPPEDAGFTGFARWGIWYSLAGIPVIHWLMIVFESHSARWLPALTEYGYVHPALWKNVVLAIISMATLGGIVSAAAWSRSYTALRAARPWFPVMALTSVMVVLQQVSALHGWYPRYMGLNMHNVLLFLYVVLWILVCLSRFSDLHVSDEESAAVSYGRWSALGVTVFLLVLVGAHFSNGEVTMRSANTRWPLWTWSQGPFPGRQ